MLGAFAIVGAGLPVAVGAAYSAKLQGQDKVAMTFFGDGATNIGTFHESLNMAATWKVGVVFVIENNLYGEYTPVLESTAVADLAERAKAHGMPGVIVDGQDIDTVHAAVTEAVDRARSGGGPSLLEMKTYRFRGHSRTDPANYRPEGELERWLKRDPITILGERLAETGALSADAQASLREEIQQLVDETADRAKQARIPTIEEVRSYVYAG
jgi:acetoin:2,6-dichlorophenolindophenol oxidoreductase subunit alpha